MKKAAPLKIKKTFMLTKELWDYYKNLEYQARLLGALQHTPVLNEGELFDQMLHERAHKMCFDLQKTSVEFMNSKDREKRRDGHFLRQTLYRFQRTPLPIRTHELRAIKRHTLRGEKRVSSLQPGTRIVHIEENEIKREVFPNGKED